MKTTFSENKNWVVLPATDPHLGNSLCDVLPEEGRTFWDARRSIWAAASIYQKKQLRSASHIFLQPTRPWHHDSCSLWQGEGSLSLDCTHSWENSNDPWASTLRDHKENGMQRKPAKDQLAKPISPGRQEKQIYHAYNQRWMVGGLSTHASTPCEP